MLNARTKRPLHWLADVGHDIQFSCKDALGIFLTFHNYIDILKAVQDFD